MRIRSIKEGFWQSETLASIPKDSRLLAIAILNYADDEGYFMDVPQVIRGVLFPFDDDSSSVRRGLDDLSSIGYIRRGTTHDGKRVCHIVNFCAHQRIDRSNPSKIAGLVASWDQFDESSTSPRRVLESGVGVGVGVGVGEHPPKPPHDENATPPRIPAGRIPATDWTPLQEHRDLCSLRNVDCDAQLSRFRERNNGQTDTDQGWGVRFTQWLGSAKPERRVSPEQVASPTLQEWMGFAKTINTIKGIGKWPKEAAEAGWHENQAKGWRFIQDWKADCQARVNRWAGMEATYQQRGRS